MLKWLYEITFGIAWWMVLFPAIIILSTPVILIASLFSDLSYEHTAQLKDSSVKNIWDDWCISLIPY